jgi:hypothetical protein
VKVFGIADPLYHTPSVVIMPPFRRSQTCTYKADVVSAPSSSSSKIIQNRLATKAALEQDLRRLDRDAETTKHLRQGMMWNLGNLDDGSIDPNEYVDVECDITYGDLIEEGKVNDETMREALRVELERIEAKKTDRRRRIQAIEKELKRLEKQCYVRM